MYTKELDKALRLITKVSNDPRIGPAEGDQLRRAKRELETVARSGKVDVDRLCIAVEIVATVLRETIETNAVQK